MLLALFLFINMSLSHCMCMNAFLVCVSVSHVCTWCPWRQEEDVGSTGTEVADGWELLSAANAVNV